MTVVEVQNSASRVGGDFLECILGPKVELGWCYVNIFSHNICDILIYLHFFPSCLKLSQKLQPDS